MSTEKGETCEVKETEKKMKMRKWAREHPDLWPSKLVGVSPVLPWEPAPPEH